MNRFLLATAFALGSLAASNAAAIELTSARLSLGMVDDDQEAPDFETRTHVGLRMGTRRSESGFSAEAAISLDVGLGQGLTFSDRSSFVRLDWRPETWSDGEGLSLTALPLISTRLHMGYEYAATWARTAMGASGSQTPALDLRLQRERWYGFVALRIPPGFNDKTHEQERLATWFAGGGLDVLPLLRIEAAAMHSDTGAMPVTSVLGARSTALGFSGRLLLHHGDRIGPEVDLTLYRADPELYERLFEPETYSDRLSLSLSLEASHRTQTLADPDRFGAVTDVSAQVFAFQGRAKKGPLRVHALGVYRTAVFPLLEAPGGFPPFMAPPAGAPTQDGALLASGVDYHFSGPGLTPGISLGVAWPATIDLTPAASNNAPPQGSTKTVLVVTPTGGLALLPDGQERQPVLTAKATVRWDAAEVVTLLAEASWTRDDYRTVFVDSAEGVAEPVADPADSIGLAAILQARF